MAVRLVLLRGAEVSAGFGGVGIAHPGRPLFACYEDGRCVAVGTAAEVAEAVGVTPGAVYSGVAPSRRGRGGRREYFRFYEDGGHED